MRTAAVWHSTHRAKDIHNGRFPGHLTRDLPFSFLVRRVKNCPSQERNRDPHAMNSASPGEPEIISALGPHYLVRFSLTATSKGTVIGLAERISSLLHAETNDPFEVCRGGTPPGALSGSPGRTRVPFCTRWGRSNFMPTSHAAAGRTGPACATSAHVAAHSRHS